MIGPDPACELCRADRFTHWYWLDEHCWVADCEACSVPMVVWTGHGPTPPEEVVTRCLEQLSRAADQRFGPGRWSVDRHMRQVPEHFHAHARDADWWQERWSRPLSRYSGVGGRRRLVGDADDAAAPG